MATLSYIQVSQSVSQSVSLPLSLLLSLSALEMLISDLGTSGHNEDGESLQIKILTVAISQKGPMISR